MLTKSTPRILTAETAKTVAKKKTILVERRERRRTLQVVEEVEEAKEAVAVITNNAQDSTARKIFLSLILVRRNTPPLIVKFLTLNTTPCSEKSN